MATPKLPTNARKTMRTAAKMGNTMDKAMKTGKSTAKVEKKMTTMLNKPKKGVTSTITNKAAARVTAIKKK